MIQFPLVIPSHLFTYPFSTINNLTHTIQPHKPQTSLVSFPSSALVSATLVNFHIVHLNLFSIFYTLTARWSQHLQLCYLCVLSLAHLCSKCPLLALVCYKLNWEYITLLIVIPLLYSTHFKFLMVGLRVRCFLGKIIIV